VKGDGRGKARGAERRESRGKGCVMAVGGIDAPAYLQYSFPVPYMGTKQYAEN